jgi:hypothetical protein
VHDLSRSASHRGDPEPLTIAVDTEIALKSDVKRTATLPLAPLGSGSRSARIQTSRVVVAPTLDRAFAEWCFTVQCATVDSVTPDRPHGTVDAASRIASDANVGSSRVLLIAIGAGLAVGIATSVGQGSLPEGLTPLGNSSGSWCLAAFALALLDRDPRRAALVGFAALVAMLVGYAVATQLRGYPVGTSMFLRWGAAAVIAGPALGVGAAWLRGPDPLRAAAGVAPITGILLGEGLYGLTQVTATTPVGYWIGELALGLAVVVLAAIRIRTWPGIALMLALSAIASGVFYFVYTLALAALF